MKRGIDKTGRIVIPYEMRKEIGLKNSSIAEINIDDNKIIITNPKGMKSREEIERVYKNMKVETKADLIKKRTLEWVLNVSNEK